MPKLIVLLLVLVGCAQSNSNSATECSGSGHVGRWYHAGSNDVLTLNNDNTGTSTVCGYNFTYTTPNAMSGNITLTIVTNNGDSGCLSAGPVNCGYDLTSTTLGLNCGGGAVIYQRQCN